MKKENQSLIPLTIVNQAQSLQVTTPKKVQIATELLSQINKQLDELIAKEEQITKPALLVIKNERARWAPYKKALTEAVATLRGKLSEYQTAEMQRITLETKKLADRVDAGTLRIDTAVRKRAELEAPTPTILTSNGSLTFRAKPTLHIIDEFLIPREYLIPNEETIMQALEAAIIVPGAEIVIIQTPVNRRA